MILSHRWLKRHLPRLPDPETVARGLEQLGIEVAATTVYGENFKMVELVEVSSRTPHPNSDHMALVSVRRGSGETTQVVTGAQNGFPGDRLWYAPPGTTLPDGRTLDVKDLRGISSPGMLLSPEELGYQAKTGELWIWHGEEPLGTTFLDVIGGLDTLYDLELTPNIAQYLQSVRRIAAELGALWDQPLEPLSQAFSYQGAPMVRVDVPDRCPLYGLVRISLVPGGVSPLWLQTLLRAVGHRIIHPAVDVTNFVLWDLGEPLHAFDARQVDGPIVVRLARPQEQLTLLDGQTLPLEPNDLVIADEKKALALAGIMGGLFSGVSDDTDEILLECAHFSAPGIFRSYKNHGLMTDAAQHFGRGTDPLTVFQAPVVVTQILEEAGLMRGVGASALVGTIADERLVRMDAGRIRDLLGVEWSGDQIRTALERFGYQVVGDTVVVPRYRHDVESLYDLAEDVARFYGLDAIPGRLPVQRTEPARRDKAAALEEDVRDLVASAGYNEVVTRTFTTPAVDAQYEWGASGTAVLVTNPLREEDSALRRFLLPSLLEVVRYNRSRHDLPIRIFEVGPVFQRMGDSVLEERELALVMSLEPITAFPRQEEPSIYDLTGIADYLAQRLGWGLYREPFDEVPTFLHPGRAQRLAVDGKTVGYLGELRPRLAASYRARRLGVMVVRFPQSLERHTSHPGRPSRFPEVQRDLSVVVPAGVGYAAIETAIQGLQFETLRDVRPIDRFIGDFGTSLTVRMTFQSDQATLTDDAVDHDVRRILEALASMGVVLRQ